VSAKVKLGRDQTLSLDGAVLEGVREVDVDIDMKTQEVTSYWHDVSSTLPISVDATVKLLIYWADDWNQIASKFNQHPPQAVTLAISNGPTIRCVPVKASIKQPIAGVLAWEVTLKPFYL
jgi:hypothetical protein